MRLGALALAGAFLAGAAQAQDAPKLVSTSPSAGAVVAPGETVLSATFDRPMTGGSFVWDTTKPAPQPVGQLALSADRKTVSLPVRLAQGTNYVVWLNSERFKNFKDDAGIPAAPYRLTFSTSN